MSKHEELIKSLRASAAAMPSDAAVAVQYLAAADALEAQAREIEGLRKDAERYRWLREKPGTDLRYGSEQYTRVCAVCQNYGEDLDAAIDAAKGAPNG